MKGRQTHHQETKTPTGYKLPTIHREAFIGGGKEERRDGGGRKGEEKKGGEGRKKRSRVKESHIEMDINPLPGSRR